MYQQLNKLTCKTCHKEFECYNAMAYFCSPCRVVDQFKDRPAEELEKTIEAPLACRVKGTKTPCRGSTKLVK